MKFSDQLTTEDLHRVDVYFNNDCNAQKTFIDLGYAPSTSHTHSAEYFRLPKIRALINDRIKKMTENVGITKEWQLNKLKIIVDRCIPDDAVKLEDVPRGDMVKGIAALTEISKIQGFYSPEKRDVNLELSEHAKKVFEVSKEVKEKNKREY